MRPGSPSSAVHRRELGELSEAVRDARVGFASRSINSLWRDWDAQASPSWLRRHVARLRARYGVTRRVHRPLRRSSRIGKRWELSHGHDPRPFLRCAGGP